MRPAGAGLTPWFLFSLCFRVHFILFRLTYKSNKALGTSWRSSGSDCASSVRHEVETWLELGAPTSLVVQ